jgi:hypothetical protein
VLRVTPQISMNTQVSVLPRVSVNKQVIVNIHINIL